MHKLIRKYQASGPYGIESRDEYSDGYGTQDFISSIIGSFNTQVKPNSGSTVGAKPSVGPKKGFWENLKNNGEMIGKGIDILDSGLQLAGLQKAGTMGGGQQALMKGMDQAANIAMKFGPVGMAVGTALKVVKGVNEYAGKTADNLNTNGISINGYTTQLGSEGAGMKFSAWDSYVGAGLGIFGKKRGSKLDNANKLTAQADRNNLFAANASYGDKKNNISALNLSGTIGNLNKSQLEGGLNTNISFGKKGMSINPKHLSNLKNKVQHKVKKAQEGVPLDDLQKIEEGGQVTNVIPEGALHARKNNYGGELGEQVTSKGIPVITYDEDDKIIQHAEIEHSEIIFHKEATNQLVDWFEEYKKAEDPKEKKALELECGKFLVEEILENTEDNVGLIEQV